MSDAAAPPPHPPEPQAPGADTRAALIAAGTAVFIDEGFRAARVQDIAQRAGVRLSAINYHFGGKEGLYLAVLQHHAALAQTHTPLSMPAGLDPQVALHAAVTMIVRRFVDPDTPSRIGALLLRELVNPTAALELMIERFSLPQAAVFRPLIAAVLGPRAPDEMVTRAMLSVFSQCMGYAVARPLILRIAPEALEGDALVERIAHHVTAFSWGGLIALRTSLETSA